MFTLMTLPYDRAALEPHMSQETLDFHYGKHHQAYVDNLNKLIAGTDLETASLEEIIRQTAGSQDKAAIFNNAAQVYNHDFFWQNLRPADSTKEPGEKIASAISQAFGSLDSFYVQFKETAMSQFGSGWAWLAKDGDKLAIMKTANADNPLAHGLEPLIAVDVWEHSYYVDYRNRRADYLDAVLRHLLNWEFIENRL